MQSRIVPTALKTLVLCVLLTLSQLIPALLGVGFLGYMLFVCAASLLLVSAIGYLEPVIVLLIGAVVPFFGLLQNLYPIFWYPLTAAIANGIMIYIVSVFKKRSILVGVLIACLFRFAYAWAMVLRLLPMITIPISTAASQSMEVLFAWPQLAGAIAGGLLSLPVLFLLQFNEERKAAGGEHTP